MTTPSKVWDFFIKKITNDNRKAECRTCGRKLTAASRSGTSHLLRHRHYKEWLKVQQAPPPSPPPPAAVAAEEDVTIFGALDDIVALDPLESELL
jgi:hypothetical protein